MSSYKMEEVVLTDSDILRAFLYADPGSYRTGSTVKVKMGHPVKLLKTCRD